MSDSDMITKNVDLTMCGEKVNHIHAEEKEDLGMIHISFWSQSQLLLLN